MSEELNALNEILASAPGTAAEKEAALLKAIQSLAPIAAETADRSANGDFLKILMQLLVQFLPILLKLLAT